jgi:hypothetical protein
MGLFEIRVGLLLIVLVERFFRHVARPILARTLRIAPLAIAPRTSASAAATTTPATSTLAVAGLRWRLHSFAPSLNGLINELGFDDHLVGLEVSSFLGNKFFLPRPAFERGAAFASLMALVPVTRRAPLLALGSVGPSRRRFGSRTRLVLGWLGARRGLAWRRLGGWLQTQRGG